MDLDLYDELLKNFFITSELSVGLFDANHYEIISYTRNEEEELLRNALDKEAMSRVNQHMVTHSSYKEEYMLLTDELRLTYAMIGLWHKEKCHHYVIVGPVNNGPVSHEAFMKHLTRSKFSVKERVKLYEYYYMLAKKDVHAFRAACKLLMSVLYSSFNPFHTFVLDTRPVNTTEARVQKVREQKPTAYEGIVHLLSDIIKYSKLGDRDNIQRLFCKEVNPDYRVIINDKEDSNGLSLHQVIVVWMLVMFSIPLFESNLNNDWIMKRLSYYIQKIVACKEDTSLTIIADQIMLEFLGQASWIFDSSYPQELLNALHYIGEHFNKDIEIREVAKKVYMNEKYFSTYFKKHMGRSYKDYINTLRIDKAKELLTYTQLDLSSIALAVGYKNQAYFSTVFKKYTGETPGAFKSTIE